MSAAPAPGPAVAGTNSSRDEDYPVVTAVESGLKAVRHDVELQQILAVQRSTLQSLRDMREGLAHRNIYLERLIMQLTAALSVQGHELSGMREDMDHVFQQLRRLSAKLPQSSLSTAEGAEASTTASL